MIGLGHQGVQGAGHQNVSDIFSAFGSMFEDFFRHGLFSERLSCREVDDIRYDLNIGFKEAIFGIVKPVEYEIQVQCHSCGGSGAASPADIVTCQRCGGTWPNTKIPGVFSRQLPPVQAVGGRGVTIKKKCETCSGSGQIPQTKKIDVNIPAGVEDGIKLRLDGKGEEGAHGGPSR